MGICVLIRGSFIFKRGKCLFGALKPVEASECNHDNLIINF